MSASDFVTLNSGYVVPVEAMRLALDLEARGCQLVLEDGGGILVGPRDLVTDDDRAGIRRWRRHFIEILTYSERVQ
jgi:hypothetical protein